MINKIKSILRGKNPNNENWHVDFLVNLASVLKPRVYVELGLYKCELFNKMEKFCDKMYGIDMAEITKNHVKKSNKIHFMNTDTNAFFDFANEQKIQVDFAFIDADHSFEGLKNDFLKLLPLMNDHGIIAVHDTHPKNEKYTSSGYCGDGYKFIEEIGANTSEFEMMTIPIHPGITLVRKRKEQLKWLKK